MKFAQDFGINVESLAKRVVVITVRMVHLIKNYKKQ